MRHFGVIDLGSNSARLSVWQINEDSSVKQVLKLKEMVRLSEGMGEDRVLQEPAMVRTIQALVGFKKQYEGMHDLTLEAYATAATRMAANQKDFGPKPQTPTFDLNSVWVGQLVRALLTW